MTWLRVVEPDDEPTTIRPYLLPVEPVNPMPDPGDEELAAPSSAMARGSNRLGQRAHIGKYELRDKLGRGSFGVVYLARDPSLERDVAIKVLRPQHLTNGDIVQRFLQEARATARIIHPGVVTIYDCGQVETTQGPTAFIAMELLSGESLTRRLARSGRLAPEIAAEIGRQVASALDAAHRADVLHRDLKPDNIYLVPDPAMPSGERVKILDFGLAKLGNNGHTQVQNVFGTPRYMSPEQCRSSAQVDHRSDIYSLGCILFELIAGRPPFDGDVRQVIDRHQRAQPPRLQACSADCSGALDQLISEMIAKDPLARPQSMGAVQRALQDAGATQIPVAETMLPVPAQQLMLAAPIAPLGPPAVEVPASGPQAVLPSAPATVLVAPSAANVAVAPSAPLPAIAPSGPQATRKRSHGPVARSQRRRRRNRNLWAVWLLVAGALVLIGGLIAVIAFA